MVSEHLEAMAEVVFAHDGIVDKYIGDLVMAVFGSPFPQSDHPEQALKCGLAMLERQRQLQADWGERVMGPLAIGIGINTGVAIVGDVGVSRREFTHLGDSVNLASRLKTWPRRGRCLPARQPTAVPAGVVSGTALPPITVKGKAAPVIAYEITRAPSDPG